MRYGKYIELGLNYNLFVIEKACRIDAIALAMKVISFFFSEFFLIYDYATYRIQIIKISI